MRKLILFIVVVLCIGNVLGDSLLVPGILPSTTTRKPWTKKVKNGIETFLQGAAAASIIQQSLHGRGKPKAPAVKPT
ncbi:unnamed protein product [Colias eurytheme]|nr:unnamed protein product [Colias eurytheme]